MDAADSKLLLIFKLSCIFGLSLCVNSTASAVLCFNSFAVEQRNCLRANKGKFVPAKIDGPAFKMGSYLMIHSQ